LPTFLPVDNLINFEQREREREEEGEGERRWGDRKAEQKRSLELVIKLAYF